MKVFALFSTAEAAETAVNGLHSETLRGEPLFIEIVHSVKYNVAAQHFDIVSVDVEKLQLRSSECNGPRLLS
jgi:hypothetical protein